MTSIRKEEKYFRGDLNLDSITFVFFSFFFLQFLTLFDRTENRAGS